MWNHCKVEQAKCAEQAGSVRWCKQWRILCCYDEDVDEVLEMMWSKEEPPIDDEIQATKTFGEFESVIDFKGFEALHIIVLNIKDQLLCSDVQTEVGHRIRRFNKTFTNWHWMSIVKTSCIHGKWLGMTCSNNKVWTLILVKKLHT